MKRPSRHRSAPENKRNCAPSSPARAGPVDTQTQQPLKATATTIAALTRPPRLIEAPEPQNSQAETHQVTFST